MMGDMNSPDPEPGRYVHRYGSDPFAPPPTAPAGPVFDPYTPGFADTQVLPLQPPPRRRGWGSTLAAAVLAGALAGVGGAAGYAALDDDADGSPATTRAENTLNTAADSPVTETDGSVRSVADKLLPSVVQINVASSSGSGNGTGIIMSTDGQILTNNHVVEVAAEGGSITVVLTDGTTAEASIVGRDPLTDIAVIQAEGVSGLTPATFGSSDELAIGEEVVAIGSPFGLEQTVTSGIVSAVNRPVTSGDGQDGGPSSVFPAVQTDAAINPGNSGGPLVDMSGNVIGINSAIQTATGAGGEGGSIGLGFAIPIDMARAIAEQILDGETPTHARIGVSVSNQVEDDQITTTGALVEEIEPDSAGENAELKVGDVVTAVDGNRVTSSDALVALIRSYRPEDTVTLTYLRDDEEREAQVTLDSDEGELAN
jgi:putative serine protease PepD